MTVLKDFIAQAQDQLIAAGIDSADLDVRLLTQHVLDWTQPKLLLNLNHVLTEGEVKDLTAAMARRAQREPVSRIIGRRGFWKSDFKVTPQTLDPRPDSETLIEAALKYMTPAPGAILDLGTGTGCLLLSLLIEWPNARGVGLDISEEAVRTAGENAAALGLVDRAEFITTNWADWLPLPLQWERAGGEGLGGRNSEDREAPHPNPLPQRGGRGDTGGIQGGEGSQLFDLVISNPPYISDSEIPGLAPEVSQYDPIRALAAGPEGLDCYRSIAERLQNWLKPGGLALFEIGHTQAQAVKSILALHGMAVIHVLPDLAGSDRVIVARRP